MKKVLCLVVLILLTTMSFTVVVGKISKGNKVIGDLNHDCIVDMEDLDMIAEHLGTTRDWGEPYYKGWADLNKDGKIDIYDLVLVGKNYCQVCRNPQRNKLLR